MHAALNTLLAAKLRADTRRAVVGVLLLAVALLPAQAAVPRSEIGRIVDDLVHRPTGLIDGAGVAHQTVTTSNTEAQAYYDQGLAWMHSYFWIEAARSFREALDRDPGIAMAELGLSRAYRNMGLRKTARAHLDRAQELKAGASEREQLTINARAIQWEAIFGPSDQRVRLHNEYRAALDDLVAKYPDDAEGWVTRGNASEGQPWGRGQLGGRQSTEWYLGALERDPDHSGAHHYLLHAYERLAQYEQATEHAAVYASGARLAPHAQHMYAHVLPRVGRWQEALAHFEEADALERAYAKAEDVPSYVDWHHLHNLHLYGMALVHEGLLDDAGAVLREAFETPGQNAIPEVFGHIPYLEYLLHAGRYVEALERANELAETHGPTGEVMGRVFACEALLSLNRTDEAAAVGAEVASLAASLGDRISGPNAAFAARQARSFDAQVDGELMLHSPDPSMLYTAERRLLPVADALIRTTGFDGWGEGLFRLVRMGRFAQRAGHTMLVDEIRERIRKLDPVYDPDFEMPAAVGPPD